MDTSPIVCKYEITQINSYDQISYYPYLSEKIVGSIIKNLLEANANDEHFEKLLSELCKSRCDNHIFCIKSLLESNKISSKGKYNSFVHVCANGWIEIFNLLLENMNVDLDTDINLSENNCRALACASSNGHIEIVKLLLKDQNILNNINCDDGFALQMALSNGYYDIGKLLLDNYKMATIKFDTTIKQCLLNGFDKCIKLLLLDPRIDLNDKIGWILTEASIHKRTSIVKLLLEDEKLKLMNPSLAICAAIDNDDVQILQLLFKYFDVGTRYIDTYRKYALNQESKNAVIFFKQ